MDIKNLIKIGLIINLSYLPIKYKLTENKYNINYIDKTTNGIRINIDEYTNVSILNNFKDLEELTISISDISKLKSINGFNKLKVLRIINNNNIDILTKEDLKFIEDSPNIEKLSIKNFNIQKGLIESVKSIKELEVNTNRLDVISNYNLDYNELTHLDKLIINGPSSIAIHMSLDEYYNLINNGVKLLDTNGNDISEYVLKYINDIESIYKNSSINDLSDLVCYIINSYKYDLNALEMDKNDVWNTYYKDGYLYGINNDNGIICGNYSALASTMLDRLNIDNYIVVTPDHAYNLIKYNDNYYGLDLTTLDSSVEEITKEELSSKKVLTRIIDKDTIDMFEKYSNEDYSKNESKVIYLREQFEVANNNFKELVKRYK